MQNADIKRQAAFVGTGKMLKGGLHCHTTRSDGEMTPEDVERYHAQHGYDFLAITDHNVYNREDFAPDAGLLIVPGMEYSASFDSVNGCRHYHTVCLGPDNDSNGFAHNERLEAREVVSQEDFQTSLDYIHDRNNLTFYCHPEWSATPPRYFERLKGEFAMELWNSGCALELEKDYNAPYWDEMLGQGHKIWGVAVDDGHARSHHCNGWVMVNAEKNVPAILEALREGRFYSSCGPEIYDFYVENEVAYVKCSPCAKVLFYCDKHNFPVQYGDDADGLRTSAACGLGGNKEYIRACVVDQAGRRAWTNPIFCK